MLILTIADGTNQTTLTLFDIVEKLIGCHVNDFIKSKNMYNELVLTKKKKRKNIMFLSNLDTFIFQEDMNNTFIKG